MCNITSEKQARQALLWNTLLLVTSHSSFMVPVFSAPEAWHMLLFLWVPDSVCLIQLSGTPEAGGQDTWAAELVKLLWKKVNGTQCGSSAVPSEACSLLASCALISSWLGSRLYQMILCICSTGIQVAFETWIIFFSSDDGRPQWICLNSEVKSSSSK